MMIEAAAQAAWSTDRGQPIVAAVVSALCTARIILPSSSVVERAAIAGRARARNRATDALLSGVSDERIAKLDRLLAFDASVNMTPFAWLKAMPVAPKADHVRELLESGLCRLTFTTRNPGGQRFRQWIATKVLAAVRKTAPHWRLLEAAPF